MVAVVEVWTSGRGDGSDRRNVFSVGESLQLNAVFLTEHAAATEVLIGFLIDGAAAAGAWNNSHEAELVFKPQALLQTTAVVGVRAAHAVARFEIPRVSESSRWEGRQEFVDAAQGSDIRFVFWPSFYHFRAFVQLRGIATGHPFDFSEPATYRIMS